MTRRNIFVLPASVCVPRPTPDRHVSVWGDAHARAARKATDVYNYVNMKCTPELGSLWKFLNCTACGCHLVVVVADARVRLGSLRTLDSPPARSSHRQNHQESHNRRQ